MNFTLQVGAAAEEVVVSAEVPQVIPTAAQIAPQTLSDARQIQFGLRLNW